MRIFLKRSFSLRAAFSGSAKPPPPPPPHSKGAETDINETLKKFESKLTEFRNLDVFKKLDTAAGTISFKNEKLYQDFSRTLSGVVQKCAESETLARTTKAVSAVKDTITPHVESLKQTEIYKDTAAGAEKIEQQLKGYLDFYDYGGVTPKEYRERLRTSKELPKVTENKDARSVVLSDRPQPKEGASSLFAKSISSIRLPKSRNVFAHFASEVVNTVADKLHGVFGESETALVIKEVRKNDPTFTVSAFLKYCQGYLIPEFVEALLNVRLGQLRPLCTDTLNVILGRHFEGQFAGPNAAKQSRFTIVDIRNCELKGAKLIDSSKPSILVSCSIQQIEEDPAGKLASSHNLYIFSFHLDHAAGDNRWRVAEYYSRAMD